MKTLPRVGGVAALYLALVNLIGMAVFLVVLDYPSLTTPADRVKMLVDHQSTVFISNLLMYVGFGVALIIFSLAVYDRMRSRAPVRMAVATVLGIVWAGSLIASGMVANAGIEATSDLYPSDPHQAALSWQAIETVATGLGNGNGEILGGLMTLLISLATLRGTGVARLVSYVGLLAGTTGVLSLIPAFTQTLVGVFGITHVAWLISMGVVLLRNQTGATPDGTTRGAPAIGRRARPRHVLRRAARDSQAKSSGSSSLILTRRPSGLRNCS